MKYLFEHGHSPHLAAKELANVLASLGVKYKKLPSIEQLTVLDTKSSLDLTSLVDILGGTIRGAKLLRRVSDEKIEDHLDSTLQSLALEINKSHQDKKLTFTISDTSKTLDTKTISAYFKKFLVELGHSVRFIESYPGSMLQPIIWNDQTLELIFVPEPSTSQWDIYSTQKVTDVRFWQKRDRSRPSVDAQSGVLPPKVARIMINLAKKPKMVGYGRLWDPFCGSGTVLMEGLLMGYKCYGVDNSTQAINDTKANLDWVHKEFNLKAEYFVELGDSSQVNPQDLNWEKMDMIVAEGYLGPSKFSFDQIPSIMEELLDLYKKTFKNLTQWVKPNGRIVLALPFFNHPQNAVFQKKLIDTCHNSGYNLNVNPLLYGQPKARVKRAIFILELN